MSRTKYQHTRNVSSTRLGLLHSLLNPAHLLARCLHTVICCLLNERMNKIVYNGKFPYNRKGISLIHLFYKLRYFVQHITFSPTLVFFPLRLKPISKINSYCPF